MPMPLSNRCFNTWCVWDYKTYYKGYEAYFLAYGPIEEYDKNNKATEELLGVSLNPKDFTVGSKQGIYIMIKLAPNVTEFRWIQKIDLRGSTNYRVSNGTATAALDQTIDLQKKFIRNSKDVDREVRAYMGSLIGNPSRYTMRTNREQRAIAKVIEPCKELEKPIDQDFMTKRIYFRKDDTRSTQALARSSASTTPSFTSSQIHPQNQLKAGQPWIPIKSTVADVKLWMQSRDTLLSSRNVTIGKAETIVDCKPEEFVAWVMDINSNCRRRKFSDENPNLPRRVAPHTCDGINFSRYGEVVQGSFPLRRRQYVTDVAWDYLHDEDIKPGQFSTTKLGYLVGGLTGGFAQTIDPNALNISMDYGNTYQTVLGERR